MKRILFYISLIFLNACGQTQSDNETQNKKILINTEDQKEEKVEITSLNSMTIKSNCVIILELDSVEIEELRAISSEEDFATIGDDEMWYSGVAGEILDSLKIKKIRCDKEFLVLQKSDGSKITLKRKNTDGDMILFNIDKQPVISSTFMIDKESISKYFDLK